MTIATMVRPALAHRVNVFAWVEGDSLIAEAKFPGSGKAKDSLIQVLDDQDRLLLEGKTDDNGRFACPTPQGVTGLKVVLDAGMGHRAEWKLSAAELGVAPAGVAPPPKAATFTQVPPATEEPPAGPGTAFLSPQQIEAAVAKAVDARLGPVVGRLDLIAARQEKIDFQNLLGALGYILGLMGLAAYWKSRSKGKTP